MKIRIEKKDEFVDITQRLRESVKSSGIQEGVCILRAQQAGVGLLHGPGGGPERLDLQEDYARMFKGLAEMAAAVGGQALDLAISGGRLCMEPGESIYAAAFVPKDAVEISVDCFGN